MTKLVYALATLALISTAAVAAEPKDPQGQAEGQQQPASGEAEPTAHPETKEKSSN
jgi:hypothetical protein